MNHSGKWPSWLVYMLLPIRLFGYRQGAFTPALAILVPAALAPAVLMLGYGVIKTKGRWDDAALWRAFRYGVLAVVLAGLIEEIASRLLHMNAFPPLHRAAALALNAGVTEEVMKFILLLWLEARLVDAGSPTRLILLSLGIGMGFGGFENLLYVADPAHWGGNAVVRALTAVPAHGVYALVMGAVVTEARIAGDIVGIRMAVGLALAAALHSAFDFAVLAQGADLVSFGPLPGFLIVLCFGLLVGICMVNFAVGQASDDDWRSWLRRSASPRVALLVASLTGASTVLSVAAVDMTMQSGTMQSGGLWLIVTGCVVPWVLSLDLLWTGLRRRAEAKVFAYYQ